MNTTLDLPVSMFDRPRRTFTETRSRNTDGQTSRDAAKAAASLKSDMERAAITAAVKAAPGGLTAYEVADLIGLDRHETSRRISECGLHKTDQTRPNIGAKPGAVWMAA